LVDGDTVRAASCCERETLGCPEPAAVETTPVETVDVDNKASTTRNPTPRAKTR
jgi:hypothetical protein